MSTETIQRPGMYDDPDRPCLGHPELFFAPDSERNRKTLWDSGPAKRLCFTCPHQIECGERALSGPHAHGVWGGLDEEERKKIIKCRNRECGPRCAHLNRVRLGW